MKLEGSRVLAGLAVAVTLAFPSGPATAQDRVSWKMGSTFPSQLTQLGTGGKRVEEQIDLVSGGEFKIRFFEPNALVPALEVFDAVAKGSIDAGWSAPGYWVGKIPGAAVLSGIPFGPSADEYSAWLLFGGGQEIWDKLYAPHGVKPIPCAVVAPESGGWFRKEITSLDELKGLKMRFGGAGAKVLDRVGVSTQLLAGGDIFPSLERGTIDATEFSQPAVDLSVGFHQVAKHYYFPGWHQQATFLEVLVNLEKWNALSETRQAQLTTVCQANMMRMLAEGEAIQAAALEEIEGHGVTIHTWPPEILSALEAAWQEVVAEEIAKDEGFQEAWASLAAFREEYDNWASVGHLK
ncbi:TRAP transporter substrate-binding protein [Roseovarius sp.]|uniref:TRAP transporter substrate-binding protein n=1 Tax=Roseovarius sp. TaxID=1486281 RepID=UPI003A96FDA3